MSPSSSTRLSGMPWQMTSFTEVQNTLREAAVIQRRRASPQAQRVGVDEIVDFLGGDAGSQHGADPLQGSCGQARYFAHERNLTLALDFD